MTDLGSVDDTISNALDGDVVLSVVQNICEASSGSAIFAQIVTAAAMVGVAVYMAIIANKQKEIAGAVQEIEKKRLTHELYKKRFEVYEETIRTRRMIFQYDHLSTNQHWNMKELLRKSRFVISEDVQSFLQRLIDEAAELVMTTPEFKLIRDAIPSEEGEAYQEASLHYKKWGDFWSKYTEEYIGDAFKEDMKLY